MPRLAIGAALAALAGGGAWLVHRAGPRTVDDPAQIARGGRIYSAECASCHGARLEGQADWRRPGPDGLLPAPPHDAAGHTWQHGNAQLYELIAHSVANIAPPGYRTGMPAFADKLTPAEIWAVIAFIKAQWPPGVRAYQDAQNPGAPPLAELPGDWTFPTTCDIHAWEAATPASPAVGAAPPAR